MLDVGPGGKNFLSACKNDHTHIVVFIQLAQWGPPAGFDKHSATLTKIFGSVKVIGK